MKMKNYREIFFTAVIICGLATALFGTEPQFDNSDHRSAEAPIVQSLSLDTAG